MLANLILSMIVAAALAAGWLLTGGQIWSALGVYAVTGQILVLLLSVRRYRQLAPKR